MIYYKIYEKFRMLHRSAVFNFLFGEKFHRLDLREIILRFSSLLHKSIETKGNKLDFSLINVVYMNAYSMGEMCAPPHSDLLRMNPLLTFTFAMTPRLYDDNREHTSPKVFFKVQKYDWTTWFWSDKRRDKDFMTHKMLPGSLRTKRYYMMMFFDIYYIYYIVGLITKNMVRYNSYGHELIDENLFSLYQKYHDLDMQTLMINYPFSYWKYSLAFWQKMPNCVIFSSEDYGFLVYYYLFLNAELRSAMPYPDDILAATKKALLHYLTYSNVGVPDTQTLVVMAALLQDAGVRDDYLLDLKKKYYSYVLPKNLDVGELLRSLTQLPAKKHII